jgi:RNA polymerase sigma-70 factor (ECF subfamily)
MSDWAHQPDEIVFAEILARRGREDVGPLVGVLLERWRRPAYYVIRRIQQSYRRGSPDDDAELFQDAACKLLDRGLDQFRGYALAEADDAPARAASPKTFFLRIVKHTAIDFYRKHREELAPASPDGDEPETSQPEAEQATQRARRAAERDEAHELYWQAFERLKAEHPNEASAWDAYHHQDMDDHEAVAKSLGITVANSYKRISRAQAHLKLYLLELRSS